MPALTLDLDLGVSLETCDRCERETGRVWATVDYQDVCAPCVKRYYSKCEKCDVYAESLVTTSENLEVCSRCADSMVTCDGCGMWSTDTSETADCRDLCEDCANDWWGCEECGALIDEGDYCSSCYENREEDCSHLINECYYQPILRFHGDGPRFLGLELEVDAPDLRECAESAVGHLGDLGYLKEDSSIDSGFEIVTHPMTYAYAMENFPWAMLRELARDGASGDGNGIHVHVSRAAFTSTAHVYRWMKLFYRNQSKVTTVARRESPRWAAFTADDRAHTKDYAKGSKSGNRYQAINSQNDATFELRIFASSLDRQEVSAALGLTDASVEYTRDLSVADVRAGAWDWPAFTGWLDSQPQYAPLSRELVALSCAS